MFCQYPSITTAFQTKTISLELVKFDNYRIDQNKGSGKHRFTKALQFAITSFMDVNENIDRNLDL